MHHINGAGNSGIDGDDDDGDDDDDDENANQWIRCICTISDGEHLHATRTVRAEAQAVDSPAGSIQTLQMIRLYVSFCVYAQLPQLQGSK